MDLFMVECGKFGFWWMTTTFYVISFIGELIALGLITPLTEHMLFENLDYD